MKLCKDCNHPVPQNQNVCPNCGSSNVFDSNNDSEIKSTESAQIHCTKCGKQIPANSNFCPFCGSKQDNVSVKEISEAAPTKPVKQLTSAEKLQIEKDKSIYTAWGYVKATLKDPESAKCNDDNATFKEYDNTVYSVVIGSVKAKNSFNTNVTDPYIVIMKKSDLSIVYGNLGGNVFSLMTKVTLFGIVLLLKAKKSNNI